MNFITKLSLLSILSTSIALTSFAADDIESLRAEIKTLKSESAKKEIDSLKQELVELKMKRLEDKMDTTEKRLDDKIQIKSEILDNKFDGNGYGNEPYTKTIFNGDKPAIPKKLRPWSFNIAAASIELIDQDPKHQSSTHPMINGASIGFAYEKNRFFGELLGTSMSGKAARYSNGYGNSYYFAGSTNTSIQGVDFRLGYKLGGSIVKFEPYVGIGATTITMGDLSETYTQFAPGAKLSIGSQSVRVYIDVAVPSKISKDSPSNKISPYYKTGTIARLGLSFAF